MRGTSMNGVESGVGGRLCNDPDYDDPCPVVGADHRPDLIVWYEEEEDHPRG